MLSSGEINYNHDSEADIMVISIRESFEYQFKAKTCFTCKY